MVNDGIKFNQNLKLCVFVTKDSSVLLYCLHPLHHSRARHRKGLLPTPKRSPLTSSPSQRISAAAAAPIPIAPPITTPPINPALSYPLPSTVAGYAGSHAHTYTTNFTATAPVQNTVIVQQPGHSVYVQQQVYEYC